MAPLPLSHYKDCEDVWERALDTPTGITITLLNAGQAIRFRQKLHAYRSRLRAINCEVYPPAHELHGSSPYDNLKVSHKPGEKTLRIGTEIFTPVVEDAASE